MTGAETLSNIGMILANFDNRKYQSAKNWQVTHNFRSMCKNNKIYED